MPKKRPPAADSMFHKIHPDLAQLAIPVSKLTSDPQNARKHSPRNLAAIKVSLDEHGQRKPLVLQEHEDGALTVRAGNGTLAAALALGWTHVAAVRVKEGDGPATAYAVRDNRTAELAEWDTENLAAALEALEAEAIAPLELGFEEVDLEQLLGERWGNGAGEGDGSSSSGNGGEQEVTTSFDVLITCTSEAHQAEVLDFVMQKGWSCRALM